MILLQFTVSVLSVHCFLRFTDFTCVRILSVFNTPRASDALELELEMIELWVLGMDSTAERSLQRHPQVLFFTKPITPILNPFIPVPWAL